MKPFLVRTLIILLYIILLNLTSTFAEESLHYELTQSMIKRICVSEIKEGFYDVSVELNRSNRESFSKLTGSNVGKILVITISGRVLTRAMIMEKIDSGIISVGGLDSLGAVRKIEEILKSNHRGGMGKNPQ